MYAVTGVLLLATVSLWWAGVRPVQRPAIPVTTEDPPETEPHQEDELPTIMVHVAGAVKNPGVYRLNQGQRLYEAINMAVAAEDADLDALNLASVLRDSERVYVPKKGETVAEPVSGGSGKTGTFPVNINSAGVAELELLPGIGPVLARAIVEYRQSNGPFKRTEDIKNVSGIGEKTYQKFSSYIVAR